MSVCDCACLTAVGRLTHGHTPACRNDACFAQPKRSKVTLIVRVYIYPKWPWFYPIQQVASFIKLHIFDNLLVIDNLFSCFCSSTACYCLYVEPIRSSLT